MIFVDGLTQHDAVTATTVGVIIGLGRVANYVFGKRRDHHQRDTSHSILTGIEAIKTDVGELRSDVVELKTHVLGEYGLLMRVDRLEERHRMADIIREAGGERKASGERKRRSGDVHD